MQMWRSILFLLPSLYFRSYWQKVVWMQKFILTPSLVTLI